MSLMICRRSCEGITYVQFFLSACEHMRIYSRSFNNAPAVVLHMRAYAVWGGSKKILHLLVLTYVVRLLPSTFLCGKLVIWVYHFAGRNCCGILLRIFTNNEYQLDSFVHPLSIFKLASGFLRCNILPQFSSRQMDASLWFSGMTCGSHWLWFFSLRAVSIHLKFVSALFILDLSCSVAVGLLIIKSVQHTRVLGNST